jgi:hypothetical protein
MESGERPLLIQTPNVGLRDGRTVTGYKPDVHRTDAGCTPDGLQVRVRDTGPNAER